MGKKTRVVDKARELLKGGGLLTYSFGRYRVVHHVREMIYLKRPEGEALLNRPGMVCIGKWEWALIQPAPDRANEEGK